MPDTSQGGNPGPRISQAERILALMRQAETADDLEDFAWSDPVRQIANSVSQEERGQLAREYRALAEVLEGRRRIEQLAGQRLVVTGIEDGGQVRGLGADSIVIRGYDGDGRPFVCATAAPAVVRTLREIPAPTSSAPALLKLYPYHRGQSTVWKAARLERWSRRTNRGNPFEEEPPC